MCRFAFVIYLASFLALLVAFEAPYWIWLDTGTFEVNMGLWQICDKIPGLPLHCEKQSMGHMIGWERATADLMICTLVVAILAGLAHFCMPVTAGLQILAGILILVADILYGTHAESKLRNYRLPNDLGPLHWAYGVCVISGVTFLINGVVLAARSRGDMAVQLPCTWQDPSRDVNNGMQVMTPIHGNVVGPPTHYTQSPLHEDEPGYGYTDNNEKDTSKLINRR